MDRIELINLIYLTNKWVKLKELRPKETTIIEMLEESIKLINDKENGKR